MSCLPLAACDCGDGGLTKMPDMDAGPGRCTSDDDCPDRESCNVSIGVCFPLDECDDMRPCENEEQICEDRDGDGFFECVFQRCTDDDECTAITCTGGLVPACIAGGCACGEPCNGGCPGNQGCCVPTDTCQPLPEQCMGLDCPLGQFVSVTSSGAWDTGMCEFLGEVCECERLPPLPDGDIGLYSALAQDSRGGVMSAYNLDYGDLMFGIVQQDASVNWEFVDGVPTTTTSITGDIDGPRGGNSDPGQDVGIHTDIVVDTTGRPHVAYQDRDLGALKYATRTSAGWQSHVVQGVGIGDTGLYSSIVLDAMERPMIAFLSAREEGPVGRRSVLRIAFALTATPSATTDWGYRDIETLQLSGFGCEDRCNVDEVCLAGNQACVVPDSAASCSPACGSGTRCVAGICQNIESLPPFRDLPLAIGLWPSMQRMPDGGVMLAYYDRLDASFKMARIVGPDISGAITIRTIDGTGSPGGSTDDAGLFPSLYVTPGGEIHVTYMNATEQSIWYRNVDGGLNTLVAEQIESGLTMGGGPDGVLIGADSTLVVDASGEVRVGYQDATAGDLRYARRTSAGNWTIFTLAGDETPYRGSFGFYSDQALAPDRTNPMVSTYRYFLSAPQGPDNGIEVFSPP